MHMDLHVNGFTDLLSGSSMEGLLEVGPWYPAAARQMGFVANGCVWHSELKGMNRGFVHVGERSV